MADATPPVPPVIAPHPAVAIAAQPAAATVITTPADGLTIDRPVITVVGGQMPLYVARPAAAVKPPVILIVHEIFGVHAHIADVARRFAHAGYLAVAPELFVRAGDPGTATSIDELRVRFVAPTPDYQVLTDLDATRAWAVANGGDPERIAITGFCWGGRIVWLYASRHPELSAGVAWYGRLAGKPTPNQPFNPVDVVPGLIPPVLGLYGGADTGIGPDQVEALRKALPAGSPSKIELFADAPHAFFADYRASYRPAAAQEAWTQALAWLKANGAGP